MSDDLLSRMAEDRAAVIRELEATRAEAAALTHDVSQALDALAVEAATLDAVTKERDAFRDKLAEQCGKTIAARHQRDAALRDVEAARAERDHAWELSNQLTDERDAMKAALQLIAAHHNKTLIMASDDLHERQAYSLGAHRAFSQCVDIALAVLGAESAGGAR